MEMDSLLVNLRMECVLVKELFSMNWLSESGLVENIQLVVEEYQQTRGLLVGTESESRNMTNQEYDKENKEFIFCVGCVSAL